MHGSGVQDFYKHQVQPDGFRIAATVRNIDVKDTNAPNVSLKRKASP